MASLGMNGPYDFNVSSIDSKITKKGPGNYALGYSKEKTFFVKCVGRSDTDIKRMLEVLTDNKSYKQFKFCYAMTAKQAFELECYNYHDFGEGDKLDNPQHPKKPQRSNWKCPVCYKYD